MRPLMHFGGDWGFHQQAPQNGLRQFNLITQFQAYYSGLVQCLDEPSRTLLGHHELQGSKSMAVYSRDMLTRPLQLYCSMLSNIRKDHFRPDESRTSRMLDLMKISENVVGAGDKATAATTQVAFEPGHVADDDGGYEPPTPVETECKSTVDDEQVEEESSEIPSSDSSSDESDSDSAGARPPAKVDIPGPVWRNRRSHVVHKCSEIEQQTACGRLIVQANFELLEQGCSSLNARCSRCFKGEVITNVGGLIEAFDRQRAKRPRAK